MAMTPDEIGRTICQEFDAFIANEPSTARWNELRERLAGWAGTIDEPAIFAGVLWVIEHGDRYQQQELAGELLNRRPVPIQLPLAEFIRRLAPRLNTSVGSVPRYLRDQVGTVEVLREVRAQLSVTNDERAKVGLHSLSYWLGEPADL